MRSCRADPHWRIRCFLGDGDVAFSWIPPFSQDHRLSLVLSAAVLGEVCRVPGAPSRLYPAGEVPALCILVNGM